MLTTTTKPKVRGWRQNPSPITMPGFRKGQRPANYGLKLPPEPLTLDEVERLLAVLGRGPCGHRNRAMVVLMWRSGLRIGETLALKPKDIDAADGTVTVLRGKGGRRRTVAVDAYALATLELWARDREKLRLTGHHHLFCTVDVRTRGRQLSDTYVRDMLKKRARQAGIEKRVHPHGLRHTMAYNLIMRSAPLGVIRDQLGHSKLATTMRYCDHLQPAEAVRWMHENPSPDAPELEQLRRAA
jgi:site-specific recombinase XerD